MNSASPGLSRSSRSYRRIGSGPRPASTIPTPTTLPRTSQRDHGAIAGHQLPPRHGRRYWALRRVLLAPGEPGRIWRSLRRSSHPLKGAPTSCQKRCHILDDMFRAPDRQEADDNVCGSGSPAFAPCVHRRSDGVADDRRPLSCMSPGLRSSTQLAAAGLRALGGFGHGLHRSPPGSGYRPGMIDSGRRP